MQYLHPYISNGRDLDILVFSEPEPRRFNAMESLLAVEKHRATPSCECLLDYAHSKDRGIAHAHAMLSKRVSAVEACRY